METKTCLSPWKLREVRELESVSRAILEAWDRRRLEELAPRMDSLRAVLEREEERFVP